jgi:hypothetical protein
MLALILAVLVLIANIVWWWAVIKTGRAIYRLSKFLFWLSIGLIPITTNVHILFGFLFLIGLPLIHILLLAFVFSLEPTKEEQLAEIKRGAIADMEHVTEAYRRQVENLLQTKGRKQ